MSLSLDALLRALADERRRRILSILRTHRSVTLADLADDLAATERGEPLPDVPAEEVEQLYAELYHQHVPTLEAADLVRYDQERDLVAVTDLGVDVVSTVHQRLAAELE